MYETLKDILTGDLHVPQNNLRPTASLDEAGLDSLALVELSMVVKQKLGINISEDELAGVSTIREIADLMSIHSAEAR